MTRVLTETLTLIGNRVATAGDFLALGEGVHKTPGWRHLKVTWVPGRFYQTAHIELVDQAGDLFRNLTSYEVDQIGKHCRKFENLHKERLGL